jgi:hypothetical protein
MADSTSTPPGQQIKGERAVGSCDAAIAERLQLGNDYLTNLVPSEMVPNSEDLRHSCRTLPSEFFHQLQLALLFSTRRHGFRFRVEQ